MFARRGRWLAGVIWIAGLRGQTLQGFDPDVSGMDEGFQLDRLGIELRTKSLRQLLDFHHQMLQIAMHAPGFAGALGLLTHGQVLGMG